MTKKSAGILLYKRAGSELRVFIVHLGGPLWEKKDFRAWSIPKGEFMDPEDPLLAAKREFLEETGQAVRGNPIPLTPVRQPSGKIVYAWAVEGDIDPASVKSNLFELEWPPKSGTMCKFPEIDRGAWFTVDEAKRRVHAGQMPIFDEFVRIIGGAPAEEKVQQGELF